MPKPGFGPVPWSCPPTADEAGHRTRGFTMNRIAAAIDRTRGHLAAGQRLDGSGPLDPTALPALEAGLANSTADWVAYQRTQSTAHAMGVISADEAQTIYLALGGEAPGPGGWAEHADLATKVVVTNVLAELVALRLRVA